MVSLDLRYSSYLFVGEGVFDVSPWNTPAHPAKTNQKGLAKNVWPKNMLWLPSHLSVKCDLRLIDPFLHKFVFHVSRKLTRN